MTKAYRISQVYDIAHNFITDRTSFMSINQTNSAIKYKFSQKFMSGDVYTLSIIQPIGPVIKPHFSVRDWEVDYKLGSIILEHNGQNLMLAQTRHSVGKAADKTTSDAEKWLTRIKSRKFFDLIDLVKQRTAGNLPLQNNSKEIFNIVHRLQELQK